MAAWRTRRAVAKAQGPPWKNGAAQTADDPNLLHIAAHGTRPGGRCPDCGRTSRAVHSRYRRRAADLPSLGHQIHVAIRARRFYCCNAKCARRIFAERSSAGCRCLRRNRPGRGRGRLAICKGRTYGTIMVDLEHRRAIDLLTALVRGCGIGQPTRPVAPAVDLDAWLAGARACGVSAVETFAGLEQDGAAVRAALTEPWSSGQAEEGGGWLDRLVLIAAPLPRLRSQARQTSLYSRAARFLSTAARHFGARRLAVAPENHVQRFSQNLLDIPILFNRNQLKGLGHLHLKMAGDLPCIRPRLSCAVGRSRWRRLDLTSTIRGSCWNRGWRGRPSDEFLK